MAKTKISEFSATPANNTDIDSINIAEGCAPSGINDAIRELMAQLKDFQTGAVGDSFNGPVGASTASTGAFTTLSATGAITSTLATGTAPLVIASTTKVANLNADLLDGADWAAPAALGSTTPAAGAFTTLSASSTVTLSGGTANGVAYLNGSKVVTSGSALTFDGTTLTATTQMATGTTGTAGKYLLNRASDGAAAVSLGLSSNDFSANNGAGGGYIFNISSTEQMRLTSTGLGIGTSSPAFKLQVIGASNIQVNAAGTQQVLQLNNSDTTAGTQAVKLGFSSAGTTKASINAAVYGNDYMTFNVGSDTERMRLDASGNLGIGTSSPAYKLDVSASANSANVIAVTNTDTNTANYSTQAYFRLNVAGNHIGGLKSTARNLVGLSTPALYLTTAGAYPIAFGLNDSATPSMVLDSSGNLGLGVTPSAWATVTAMQVKSTSLGGYSSTGYLNANAYYNAGWKYINTLPAARYEINAGDTGAHQWYTAPSGTAGTAITFTQAMTLTAGGKLFVNTTSGFIGVSNVKVDVGGRYNSGISGVGSYSFGAADGGGAFVINDTSNGSTEVERMRINSSGNVGIGQTSPAYKLDVFGTTPAIRLIANGVSNGVKLEQSSATGDVELNVIDGYALKFATSNTERARIDSSGNFNIGNSGNFGGKISVAFNPASQYGAYFSPSSGTYTNGFLGFNNSGGSLVGSVTTNGSITVYNTTSDYRLKTVVGAVTGQGARIDALEPIEYEWKETGTRTRGFLAHKFQEVYADSVTGTKDAIDADGKPIYQAMQASSSEVIADLVAEIQSLRKRLADAGL